MYVTSCAEAEFIWKWYFAPQRTTVKLVYFKVSMRRVLKLYWNL